MARIDWDEFREYRKYSIKEDKLEILVDFMKSFYNITSLFDMYDHYFKDDDIVSLMLKKRDLNSAEDLENFVYKRR